ncbi:UMP kinase [Candidatus Comchoanobacter bicostacola]|uniref:Uridylate kinase n=1 Tax=Candidatus Comchoanobacter bicostacola TaxID=2919598 RepID=A0ABY5DK47_9GAMM|nr:UMP kinase [Candidatus Comchoanobacter bicostacola]UTC24659.1 UMP kinase [Candidatus Comchoanobacter bicostacola]
MLYKRVLIKVSGQILRSNTYLVDIDVVHQVARHIVGAYNKGIEVAVVVGAGNLCRGSEMAEQGISRVTSDQVGMIATNMNALVIQEVIESYGLDVCVMSAFTIGTFVDPLSVRVAKKSLSEGKVVIFSGGTGNAFVTTDSAASLRAVEIEADLILKGTRVDGVYSADPEKDSSAKLYDEITFQQAINQSLNIMDIESFRLCQSHSLPICVFNIKESGAVESIVEGNSVGTMVRGE